MIAMFKTLTMILSLAIANRDQRQLALQQKTGKATSPRTPHAAALCSCFPYFFLLNGSVVAPVLLNNSVGTTRTVRR
jgi:hypothetical protein